MARTRGKVDGNHADVVKALRESGISAVSLACVGKGFPDVVAGYRGANFLLEIKDGSLAPSARQLTQLEKDFHATWSGHVCIVESPEGAVFNVIEAAKALGLV